MDGASLKHADGNYLGELLANWQPMLAACMGLIAGTVSIYLNNLFSPHLIAEFGWDKADFALIGMTTAISVVALPIAGRLADRFGMRRIALVGVVGLPVVFVGLAFQPGSFAVFFLFSTAQMLIVSALAGIVVYTRLLVRYFVKARGLALGIASCTPALATTLFSPALSWFIEAFGWRAGYLVMAAVAGILGAAALLTVPRDFRDADSRPSHARTARKDYGELLRSRAFLVIFGAMILCNLHFSMQTTQLSLIMQERHMSAQWASVMISIFAMGVIIGRIVCGIALDRYEPRGVAFLCFLFPAAGLAIMATGSGGPVLMGVGIMSLGFSVGAEGDVAAYLATRYFRPELYSSVVGLFASAMAISALIGAFVLNRIVAATNGYSLFLLIASVSVLSGAVLFLLLGKQQTSADDRCAEA